MKNSELLKASPNHVKVSVEQNYTEQCYFMFIKYSESQRLQCFT